MCRKQQPPASIVSPFSPEYKFMVVCHASDRLFPYVPVSLFAVAFASMSKPALLPPPASSFLLELSKARQYRPPMDYCAEALEAVLSARMLLLLDASACCGD